MVETLIELGADVNMMDDQRKTALYWAKWMNYRGIIKVLRENGAYH